MLLDAHGEAQSGPACAVGVGLTKLTGKDADALWTEFLAQNP